MLGAIFYTRGAAHTLAFKNLLFILKRRARSFQPKFKINLKIKILCINAFLIKKEIPRRAALLLLAQRLFSSARIGCMVTRCDNVGPGLFIIKILHIRERGDREPGVEKERKVAKGFSPLVQTHTVLFLL
jgi:hypothetical protein